MDTELEIPDRMFKAQVPHIVHDQMRVKDYTERCEKLKKEILNLKVALYMAQHDNSTANGVNIQELQKDVVQSLHETIKDLEAENRRLKEKTTANTSDSSTQTVELNVKATKELATSDHDIKTTPKYKQTKNIGRSVSTQYEQMLTRSEEERYIMKLIRKIEYNVEMTKANLRDKD